MRPSLPLVILETLRSVPISETQSRCHLFWLVYCFVAIFLLGMLDGVSVSADAVVGWQNQLGQRAWVSRGLRSFFYFPSTVSLTR